MGATIFDLAPLTESVSVGDKTVIVKGIALKPVMELLLRFPSLLNLLAGAGLDAAVFAQTPGAAAAVIASGCGHHGDDAAEAMAALLPLANQVDLVHTILRLTVGDGGPFGEKVMAIAKMCGLQLAAGATSSPEPKANSSPPDTESQTSGP